MTPVAEVRRMAARGALELRRVNASPIARIHAVPLGQVSAVCGFFPAGAWHEQPPVHAVACRLCLAQLQRAGLDIVRGSLCALREDPSS